MHDCVHSPRKFLQLNVALIEMAGFRLTGAKYLDFEYRQRLAYIVVKLSGYSSAIRFLSIDHAAA
jgi:hypothetical protein